MLHLELHTIVVCQDVVGPNENSFGSMFVPPSHVNDHGHIFSTLFVGTYRVIKLCCLVVLRSTIFDASIVHAFFV